MLRRLLAGLVALLLTFAVGVTVPLARLIAEGATQTVYTDRLADAEHYATVAGRALADDRTAELAGELHQYAAVYGIRAWLLGVDYTTVVSFDGTSAPDDVRHSPEVDLAVRGVQPPPPAPVTPGTRGSLVVAVPVGTGAEAVGALVTLSPLEPLRAEVTRRWALLGVVAALATLLLLAATVPFTRWLLRPVARLDAAAGEIAAGRLESRVGLAAGPPELRRLARSFDRMAAVVERTLQRQQQFVGDASHQLRTPLTSLRLSLENLGALLPEDPGDPARAEHREALEEVRAMGRMFEGLLAITRLGSEPALAESVDDVLAGGRVGWQARCASAGLAVLVEAESGLVVLAPPGGLRHLLDELVENACRLSDGRTVTVSARRLGAGPAGSASGPGAAAADPTGGGLVEVAVRDDGQGLDDEQRVAATRRFWRARDQQNTAGSGLGLAIVAELVHAADGSVELRDAGPGLEVALLLRPASGLVGAQPGESGGVQGGGTGGDRRPDVDTPAVGVGPEAP
ncbi:MAG TPA: HAMP domain-containing sensor histidine kinase [Kineosporiaceae bacterium]